MKTIFRILLFPVVVLLTVFVSVCRLICQLSGIVLGLLSFLILAIALGLIFLLQDTASGIKVLGLAFLISPFGVPLLITFLIELLGVFKDALKAI